MVTKNNENVLFDFYKVVMEIYEVIPNDIRVNVDLALFMSDELYNGLKK